MEIKSIEPSRKMEDKGAVNQYTKIGTYAVLFTRDPMESKQQEAKDDCSDEKAKAQLNACHYVWFLADGIKGDAFIIYNITLSDALHIGERLKQKSIVWCNNVAGEMQCWEQDGNGGLKKAHMQSAAFDREDEALNDMMARHNKILSETISQNLKRYGLDASYEERKVRQMLSDNTTERVKWEARGNLYVGYQKQCVDGISLADSHESQSYTP